MKKRILILAVATLVAFGAAYFISLPSNIPKTELSNQEALALFDIESLIEIQAFVINKGVENPYQTLIIEGNLNPNREPKEGKALNPDQLVAFHSAITGDHPDYDRAMCFEPHHSFLFIGEGGEHLHVFDLCFLCNNHRSSWEGTAGAISLPDLKSLVRNLGFPVSPF